MIFNLTLTALHIVNLQKCFMPYKIFPYYMWIKYSHFFVFTYIWLRNVTFRPWRGMWMKSRAGAALSVADFCSLLSCTNLILWIIQFHIIFNHECLGETEMLLQLRIQGGGIMWTGRLQKFKNTMTFSSKMAINRTSVFILITRKVDDGIPSTWLF